MFKKRKGPPKGKLRTRKREPEPDDADEAESEETMSIAERIQSLKVYFMCDLILFLTCSFTQEEQQVRARQAGTNSENLSRAPRTLEDEAAEVGREWIEVSQVMISHC